VVLGVGIGTVLLPQAHHLGLIIVAALVYCDWKTGFWLSVPQLAMTVKPDSNEGTSINLDSLPKTKEASEVAPIVKTIFSIN
jgi:hypothetical protein